MLLKLRNLRSDKTFKEIWKIAIPIACESMLISLIGLVDNLFVGNLDNAKLVSNGVNAISNLNFIITTIVVGFISGIGIMFAKSAGANNINDNQKLFKTKIYYSVFFSIILITIFTIFLKDIASLWISDEDKSLHDKSLDFASDYGSIIFPTLFIDFLVICISSSFKEFKKVKVAVLLAIGAIIINASLNYPFMFLLNMGVKGSAWATLISKCFLLIAWLIYLMVKKPTFIPGLKEFFNIKEKWVIKVFPRASIWMLNALFVQVAFTIEIMFMSKYSLEAGTALMVAGAIASLVVAWTNGFSQASSILLMHKLGLEKTIPLEYEKNLKKYSFITGAFLGLLLALISILPLFIYPKYSENIKIQAMIMVNVIALFMWVRLITSVNTAILKGWNYKWLIILIDGIVSWLLIVPLTWVLTTYTTWDIGWIYWIITGIDLIKLLLFSYTIKKVRKIK